MSIRQTEAIVLRSIDYSNSSRIVTLLTPDVGQLRLLAKGAKRPKSPFLGTLDAPSLLEIAYSLRPGADLGTLTEALLKTEFRAIRENLVDFARVCNMLELAGQFGREGEREEDLFKLLLDALTGIEGGLSSQVAGPAFHIRLLAQQGFLPEFGSCVKCGKDLKETGTAVDFVAGGWVCGVCKSQSKFRLNRQLLAHFRALGGMPWDRLNRLRIPPKQAEFLQRLTMEWTQHVTERGSKAASFLQKLAGAAHPS